MDDRNSQPLESIEVRQGCLWDLLGALLGIAYMVLRRRDYSERVHCHFNSLLEHPLPYLYGGSLYIAGFINRFICW